MTEYIDRTQEPDDVFEREVLARVGDPVTAPQPATPGSDSVHARIVEALLADGYRPATHAGICEALVPLVDSLLVEAKAEALEEAVARVQSVYDMQCPVLPASDYMDAGAYHAHTWWKTVLGGELKRLRARAAAYRTNPSSEETHRGR